MGLEEGPGAWLKVVKQRVCHKRERKGHKSLQFFPHTIVLSNPIEMWISLFCIFVNGSIQSIMSALFHLLKSNDYLFIDW